MTENKLMKRWTRSAPWFFVFVLAATGLFLACGNKTPDCFSGTPRTQEDFLNACTDADRATFTTPLPRLNSDGSLPPLPTQ
ncbi:MAG TPA: hypothetical protein VH877_29285 [Polyangia bacterium]|jgi:hypothetical protein|nr:hypothetical protein [Polyangia bacterium]